MDGSGGKNASVEAIASKNVTFIIRVVLDTDFEAGYPVFKNSDPYIRPDIR